MIILLNKVLSCIVCSTSSTWSPMFQRICRSRPHLLWKMISIRELIPSLGKELDELRARVASLEGLFGVGDELHARLSCLEGLLGTGASAQKSSKADESCRMCGITWQLGATCYPQHMAGKRHRKNLAKLPKVPSHSPKVPFHPSKVPSPLCKVPSSSKVPSPSSSKDTLSFRPSASSSPILVLPNTGKIEVSMGCLLLQVLSLKSCGT